VSSVSATTPVVATGTSTPDISLASGYGDTQNPYASKTANHILAAPNGTAGVPTFRAIVGADIPTLNQNTTGTASNVTGIVAVANGGTGTATPSLVAGTGVTITGTFPNQTINSSGGGGGGVHILTKPVSGRTYSIRTDSSSASSSTVSVANLIYLSPFIPANALTISNLQINVVSLAAGASARILVYSDSNGVPNTKLIESTTLDCSTTGAKTYTTSYTFTAGTTYWLGVYTNNASFQMSAMSAANTIPVSTNGFGNAFTNVTAAATFGSAPTTLGSTSLVTGTMYVINLTAA
ncbi:MAG: hypothetical protein EBT02_14175, partial [Planctomycetia bacterium]|nr:hypothetical protein [Planctomycetia bacterium]